MFKGVHESSDECLSTSDVKIAFWRHFRALMCLIHRYEVFPVAWYSVEEAV